MNLRDLATTWRTFPDFDEAIASPEARALGPERLLVLIGRDAAGYLAVVTVDRVTALRKLADARPHLFTQLDLRIGDAPPLGSRGWWLDLRSDRCSPIPPPARPENAN